MSKKREYVRQSESQHPSAIEFSSFVHKLHEKGQPVTRAMAIKWIISSYKREALIRSGARKRATDSIRADRDAGGKQRKQEQTTRMAVAFTRDGATINESQAEAFVDSGISVVLQRLVSCRAGTYVYDKDSKLFLPVSICCVASEGRNVGVVRKILSALSEGDLTAAGISERCSVDVGSVRNNLNRLRKAGAVEQVGKERGQGPRKTQIVYRLKEADCNLST
jgi:DNA-binding transcriptional ArsR family regulator